MGRSIQFTNSRTFLTDSMQATNAKELCVQQMQQMVVRITCDWLTPAVAARAGIVARNVFSNYTVMTSFMRAAAVTGSLFTERTLIRAMQFSKMFESF